MAQGSKLSLTAAGATTGSRTALKSGSNSSISQQVVEDKLHELRDTAEIVMETLTAVVEPCDEFKPNFSVTEASSSDGKVPQVPISSSDFADMSNQVFNKFKRAIVSACVLWHAR